MKHLEEAGFAAAIVSNCRVVKFYLKVVDLVSKWPHNGITEFKPEAAQR